MSGVYAANTWEGWSYENSQKGVDFLGEPLNTLHSLYSTLYRPFFQTGEMPVPLDACRAGYAATPFLEIGVFEHQRRILRIAICMETTSVLANKVASFFWLPVVRSDWQALPVQPLKSFRSCKACAGSDLCACKVFCMAAIVDTSVGKGLHQG